MTRDVLSARRRGLGVDLRLNLVEHGHGKYARAVEAVGLQRRADFGEARFVSGKLDQRGGFGLFAIVGVAVDYRGIVVDLRVDGEAHLGQGFQQGLQSAGFYPYGNGQQLAFGGRKRPDAHKTSSIWRWGPADNKKPWSRKAPGSK